MDECVKPEAEFDDYIDLNDDDGTDDVNEGDDNGTNDYDEDHIMMMTRVNEALILVCWTE